MRAYFLLSLGTDPAGLYLAYACKVAGLDVAVVTDEATQPEAETYNVIPAVHRCEGAPAIQPHTENAMKAGITVKFTLHYYLRANQREGDSGMFAYTDTAVVT